jgi:hypothetical protein
VETPNNSILSLQYTANWIPRGFCSRTDVVFAVWAGHLNRSCWEVFRDPDKCHSILLHHTSS